MRLGQALLVALAIVACSGGSGANEPCDVPKLVALAKGRAGPNAIDCGRVGIDEDPGDAATCVESSLQEQSGFYVIFDEQGIDSTVARSWAGTASGQVFGALWDSDPSGGSGAPPRISEFECLQPTLLDAREPNELFECDATGSVTAVCGD